MTSIFHILENKKTSIHDDVRISTYKSGCRYE